MLVKVQSPFLSGESAPLGLQAGQVGSVLQVDKDGDAHIYFSELVIGGESERITREAMTLATGSR